MSRYYGGFVDYKVVTECVVLCFLGVGIRRGILGQARNDVFLVGMTFFGWEGIWAGGRGVRI